MRRRWERALVANEMTIYAGAINRDHVHILISIPTHLSAWRASDP